MTSVKCLTNTPSNARSRSKSLSSYLPLNCFPFPILKKLLLQRRQNAVCCRVSFYTCLPFFFTLHASKSSPFKTQLSQRFFSYLPSKSIHCIPSFVEPFYFPICLYVIIWPPPPFHRHNAPYTYVYIILTLWMKIIKHTYFERMLVWIQLTPTPYKKQYNFHVGNFVAPAVRVIS